MRAAITCARKASIGQLEETSEIPYKYSSFKRTVLVASKDFPTTKRLIWPNLYLIDFPGLKFTIASSPGRKRVPLQLISTESLAGKVAISALLFRMNVVIPLLPYLKVAIMVRSEI